MNQLSLFWFRQMEDVVKNHVLESDADRFPEGLKKHADALRGRSMVVRKAKPFPVECVVRGYLSGSGWTEYKQKGGVCGIALPAGLEESARLPEPIFTPTTKADEGHDMAISMEQVKALIGEQPAIELERLSIALYKRAAGFAQERGIIIADTKFEFGRVDDQVIVIDEVLTPDSSRFWSAKDYRPGQGQDSFDKQIVRDYLNTLDWDKTYPGPPAPAGDHGEDRPAVSRDLPDTDRQAHRIKVTCNRRVLISRDSALRASLPVLEVYIKETIRNVGREAKPALAGRA